MASLDSRCPESVYGIHDTYDVDGRCLLCRQKIAPKERRPAPQRGIRSDLDLSYRYMFDPDWGNDRYDDVEVA